MAARAQQKKNNGQQGTCMPSLSDLRGFWCLSGSGYYCLSQAFYGKEKTAYS
jgi:hypothetical protein